MEKDEYALFKYSIIAPFINGTALASSVRDFCVKASKKEYLFNDVYLSFHENTIRKWIQIYKEGGYEALKRKDRCDKRKSHTLDEDLQIRIDDIKMEFPNMRATVLHSKLIKEGYFTSDDISIRTFQRFVKNRNYLSMTSKHERRSYVFEHPNDSWQSDTTHGPYIEIKGKKYKTYIVIFIDDHSRLVTGARAYFRDTALNMQKLFKESVRRYGVPKQLYCDNGGPYSNRQLQIICARMGVNLKNAKPYDPESKGKVERFNRTLKDTWMNTMDWNLIRDLEDLNERLDEYIKEYNNTVHSSIKRTPNKQYYSTTANIRYIDEETLERYFYHTITRKVNKTGCIKLENKMYELDYAYTGKIVEVTYNPEDMSTVYVENKAYGLLDTVRNSTGERKKSADYSKVVNKEDEETFEYEDE